LREACHASTAPADPVASISSSMNGPLCPSEKEILAKALEPGGTSGFMSLTNRAQLGSLEETPQERLLVT
jgi:hypothetical protein